MRADIGEIMRRDGPGALEPGGGLEADAQAEHEPHGLSLLGRRHRLAGTRNEPGPSLDTLTDRQRQVAELAAQGKRNREIAAELYLSVATVEKHLTRVFDKLGVSSRVAVTAIIERSRHRSPA